jgi:hypothetical protein
MKHDDYSEMKMQELLRKVHRQQMLDEPETRLLDGIRHIYRAEVDEDARLLERVLTRLVDESGEEKSGDQLRPYSKGKEEKILSMQNTTNTVVSEHSRTSGKRLLRRVNLLVAVLICVALVGSLALVLAASHIRPMNTLTGHQNLPITITKPTKQVNCQANSDLAEETLCAQGLETDLNSTKNFTTSIYDTNTGMVTGPGTVNVTFLRAYADTSRLILVYTINKTPGTWGDFVSLTTSQGVLAATTTLGAAGSTSDKGFFTQSFSTTNLAAGTTQVQLESLTARYTTNSTSVPLAFTLPFHATASKTVPVNQNVSGQGYTLTLNHVVLTNSLTTLALTVTFPAQHPQAILIEVTSDGQSELWRIDNNAQGASTCDCSFSQSLLLAHPGSSWNINVKMSTEAPFSVLQTGTFTFTIPA